MPAPAIPGAARLLAPHGGGRLLWPGPVSGIVAVVVAMAMVCAAAWLALGNAADAAMRGVRGGLTIQILSEEPATREAEVRAVMAVLQRWPGVAEVRRVPQAEVEAIVAPWLGMPGQGEVSAAGVPALVEARMAADGAPVPMEGLRTVLPEVAPSVRVDADAAWMAPVEAALVRLRGFALLVLGLMAAALLAAVLVATRGALVAGRERLALVEVLGATDGQIAGLFQRAVALEVAGGSLAGALAGALALAWLGHAAAPLAGDLATGALLTGQDWIILPGIPVASIALAMLAARFSVLHALRKTL